MDITFKELCVVDGMMEAEIIKSKLESHSVRCMLKYESAGRLFGITMNGLGKVKVMVAEDQYQLASEIIADVSPPSDP